MSHCTCWKVTFISMLTTSIEVWNLCPATSLQRLSLAFVTCSCKNGLLPLFSKTVVCCGYKFMPGKKQKEKQILEKWDVTPLACVKAALLGARAVWKVWQPKPALKHILCIALHSLLWNQLGLSCAQVFPLRDSTERTNPFEVLGSLWNDQSLVCPPCPRGELSDIQLAATHIPVSTQSSFASSLYKIHLRMNPLG